MPDILHDFPIAADAGAIFQAISTPDGLDAWWTKQCVGMPIQGGLYRLHFGKGDDWEATVYDLQQNRCMGWLITRADKDWLGTRVVFFLNPKGGPNGVKTQVRFQHLGWPAPNEHYRVSSFCWAMYLRLLRRHVEHGEVVPYEKRLEV